MKRKWLATGIILLFVAIAFFPITNARNNTIVPKPFSTPEKVVSITVLEYKADGTIGKYVVKMTQGQAERLNRELSGVKDLDIQLSIYKKYNLIPQDVTAEKLRRGMEEKAQRLGSEVQMLQEDMTKWKSNNFLSNHFCMNTFCVVESDWILGLRFLGGLSLITSIFNAILFASGFNLYLPSIDLFQINIGYFGDLYLYDGILPDSSIGGLPIASFILGFVGYYLSAFSPTVFITFWGDYAGYAVACLGFQGIPLYY
jgi:hypothetical protein